MQDGREGVETGKRGDERLKQWFIHLIFQTRGIHTYLNLGPIVDM